MISECVGSGSCAHSWVLILVFLVLMVLGLQMERAPPFVANDMRGFFVATEIVIQDLVIRPCGHRGHDNSRVSLRDSLPPYRAYLANGLLVNVSKAQDSKRKEIWDQFWDHVWS